CWISLDPHLSGAQFHHVLVAALGEGAPFEPLDQGESRTLTHWEQLDDGVQFTANKKFLLVVPTVVFLLATFYSRYDQIHFIANALSLVVLSIAPKLPMFYRVRLFGINKW
uniref:Ormdl n=1 Tax=Macrostomum lignano TaxID=282301 RepID=A0A1I8JQG9_9PLAT